MSRLRVLFGSAVFLASSLLFLVEPMAARQLLPMFGGSAAVWITCLVFFQTALLVAYLYAHWLAHRPNWFLHVALLLVAGVSAVFWTAHAPKIGGGPPVFSIFASLGLSIGLPFLMLGATSPLLQVWLARIQTGPVPYRLFALSNLASLLALAAYPWLIEPNFTLRAQRLLWCSGFAAFALLSALLAWRTRSTASLPTLAEDTTNPAAPGSPLTHKLLWVLLPMGAAMQLSAITSYITQNIAAIPLLWIVPLAVYLVTLILAFQFPRLLPRGILMRFLVVTLGGLGYMLAQSTSDTTIRLPVSLSFFMIELFFACLFCHMEVYALRPRRHAESTLFYLLFAAGGALGSFVIGIASPLIFAFNYDLVLTAAVTAALALAVTWSGGWPQRMLWGAATVLMLVLVGMFYVAYQRNTPVAVRNFYGSLRVRESLSAFPGALTRTLSNGIIQHGSQIFTPEMRRTPTTYYAEDSGVGLALRNCCHGRSRNIGVVGLGVGTIAAYGQPGDRIRFYEINPAVYPIAQNLFTYMRDSAAQVDSVEGDARLTLAGEQPMGFDVLVIDAFSGDAIPIHLLTTQAVDSYKRHLAPGGILAFHISNQHVDLEPETALLARAAGMDVRKVTSYVNEQRGEFTATWMLMTKDSAFFAQPEVAPHVRQPTLDPKVKLWTDDYSSLLPLIRW